MLTNFAYTESDACGSDLLLGEVTLRVLQEETRVVTKEVTLRSDRLRSHVMIKIMNRNEKEKLKVIRRFFFFLFFSFLKLRGRKKGFKKSDYYRINVSVVKCYQENDGMLSTATHAVTLIITGIGLNGVWIDQ